MQENGLISAARRMPNAAWAWEGLRRNPAYRADYRAHVHAMPATIPLYGGARLLRAPRRYLSAEEWGLLTYADPYLTADEANVFWRPDLLAGALRVKLTPLGTSSDIDDGPSDTIALSALKTRRVLLETVDGARHILLNGRRFWIQLYSIKRAPVGDQAEVDIRFDGADHMQRRLDTAAQLLALHRSAGGKLSLIGRRRNTRPLSNALNAYDIWHGFDRPKGSLEDVAEMIVGKARMAADWGANDRALKAQAKRAIAKGEAFVAGDYRHLLAQKVL